ILRTRRGPGYRIEPGLANERIHGSGLQQTAAVVVNANVLPGHLHHLFAVDRDIHLGAIAVTAAGLAGGQTGAAVAVEGMDDRLRRSQSRRKEQAQNFSHGNLTRYQKNSLRANWKLRGPPVLKMGLKP